jgi:hypothetical protein
MYVNVVRTKVRGVGENGEAVLALEVLACLLQPAPTASLSGVRSAATIPSLTAGTVGSWAVMIIQTESGVASATRSSSVWGVQVDQPDPQCVGRPWRNREGTGCGLGYELVLLLPLVMWARRAR